MLRQPQQIRCFIAIELPERIKDGLTRIESVLKDHDPSRAKWVDPEGIHLTLKFLGNVEAARLEPIAAKMDEAAAVTSPFNLGIQGLGAFPTLRRVQVVWVGIKGDLVKLAVLQQGLEKGLAEIGFPAENRPFIPHLTLARLRETATPEQRQMLGEFVAGLKVESDLTFEVAALSLMRSRLTQSGAVYNELASVKL